MANDYFEKPAKLVVKNGEMRVQIPMNHSAWITEFKAPENGNFVDSKVVSKDEAADKRTVEFKVDDLSKPAAVKFMLLYQVQTMTTTIQFVFAFDANVKAVGGDNGVTAATKNNDQAKTDTQVKEEKTKVESKETAKEASKETKNENGKS
ncbi:NEAT domain-containing protein [Bacillus pacificus]